MEQTQTTNDLKSNKSLRFPAAKIIAGMKHVVTNFYRNSKMLESLTERRIKNHQYNSRLTA